MSRIADKVDINAIYFEKVTRGRTDSAVVTFAKSTKGLFFNPKMVKILNIYDWEQVMVGYDRNLRPPIIILKKCAVEECGAVKVKIPSPSCKGERVIKRAKNCRTISISHLVSALGLTVSVHYKAERDGEMLFLEMMDE